MTTAPDRYAVIGHPVDHSRSPAIHAAFAAQTGEAIRYDRLPAPRDGFVATATEFFDDGGAGLNVTLPFKQQAHDFADELSDRARRAGAVNTLARREDGRIFGDNTDGVGLTRDLVAGLGIALADRRLLILGAGGAVRGVMAPLLAMNPARLCLANRTRDKARAIADQVADLGPVETATLEDIPAGWDLVINAISAGLSGEMPALPDRLLDQTEAVYDMVYADTATPFLRHARRQGVNRRRDGFGMLVEQAAESFAIWRGIRPDTAPVIAALRPGGATYHA